MQSSEETLQGRYRNKENAPRVDVYSHIGIIGRPARIGEESACFSILNGTEKAGKAACN
jgi:hypothetical protein